MTVRVIGRARWKLEDVDNFKHTYSGFSTDLKLDEIDVPNSAEAYYAYGLGYEDSRQGIPEQLIVSFLYFKKK